jgi:adenylate cyclase
MESSVYNRLKSQTEKVAWITFFWILVALSQFIRGYVTLIQFNCVNDEMSVLPYIQGSLITGLVAGLIGGTFMVFFWENWLRTQPYGLALVNIAWSYSLIFLVVAFISGLFFNASQLGVPLLSKEIWSTLWTQFFSIDQFYVYLFWLFVVVITLIGLSVNDKYGPGVFKSFILGKYFHPKREERIFMFLDLRSSTTIAEKLGEEKYFNFLKDLFMDATPAILNSKGQIYQYVGDEIVISWKTESGTENANCIQCFFDIQQCLLDKAAYYQEKYDNVTPQFKAGLHYGAVMVGEMGIVKRDIVYSGDVLNTAARIQSKCNELGKNIILSKYLLEKLEPLPNPFRSIALGEMELRGKQESVMLYTV